MRRLLLVNFVLLILFFVVGATSTIVHAIETESTETTGEAGTDSRNEPTLPSED